MDHFWYICCFKNIWCIHMHLNVHLQQIANYDLLKRLARRAAISSTKAQPKVQFLDLYHFQIVGIRAIDFEWCSKFFRGEWRIRAYRRGRASVYIDKSSNLNITIQIHLHWTSDPTLVFFFQILRSFREFRDVRTYIPRTGNPKISRIPGLLVPGWTL